MKFARMSLVMKQRASSVRKIELLGNMTRRGYLKLIPIKPLQKQNKTKPTKYTNGSDPVHTTSMKFVSVSLFPAHG